MTYDAFLLRHLAKVVKRLAAARAAGDADAEQAAIIELLTTGERELARYLPLEIPTDSD